MSTVSIKPWSQSVSSELSRHQTIQGALKKLQPPLEWRSGALRGWSSLRAAFENPLQGSVESYSWAGSTMPYVPNISGLEFNLLPWNWICTALKPPCPMTHLLAQPTTYLLENSTNAPFLRPRLLAMSHAAAQAGRSRSERKLWVSELPNKIVLITTPQTLGIFGQV